MREVKVVDEALSEWLKKNGKAPLMTESHLTTIETHWHSIGRSDATGAITGTAITNTIAHLNNVYAASGFYFDLTRIDQTNNDLYYSGAGFDNRVDFNMKASTRSGNQAVLNIWSVGRTENFVVEYATYPWNYESDPIRDGVVFEIGAATGGSYADFNEGDVLVHAVGHWLGLLHPFENQCLPPGDFVEDTPPQSEPVYGCPLVAPTNPCGGASNYQNFMDFTDDACKFFFTLGQAERMAIAWDIYRAPGLLPNTPTVAPVTLFPTPGSALTPGQGCLSATPVSTSATISSTTVGAPAYETTACGSTFDVISPGVWYKVTGDGRTLSASTCSNTNYDSMISVYAATSCSQLTCITGNDDFCGLQSAVEWVGLAGVDYLIYVHGYNGIEGPFQLVISPTSLPAPTNPPAPTPAPTLPPTLDSNVLPLEAGCAVTSAISVGSTVSSSTVGAPRYQSRACGTIPAEVSAGVWYKATGTGGVLTAHL